MKLLIILRIGMPFKLSSGGRQAVFNMIDYLRHHMDITIFYWDWGTDSEEDKEELKLRWDNVKFYAYKHNNKIDFNIWTTNKIFNRIINRIFKKSPDYLEYSNFKEVEYPENFLTELSNLLKHNKFDFVQTEFYNSLDLVYILPSNVKKVFIQHEIRYVRNKLLFNTPSELSLRLKLKMNKQKDHEIQGMNHYDAVMTLSDIDLQKLEAEMMQTKLFSSPVTIFPGKRYDGKYENSVTFLGGGGHPPNVEGLDWFLENVWKKVVDSNSKMIFHIIGKWPNGIRKKIEKEHKNIKFLGFVNDLGAILAESIMVIPILTGSGIRMKILDAMYYGSPIVSTSVGIEGLEFTQGENCYIKDDAFEFAKAIIDLDKSEKIRNKLRLNSKKLFDEKYSFKALGERRLKIYKELYTPFNNPNNGE